MLSKLPIELLALILVGETSHVVVELYKSGDKVLIHKLANGGCVEVHLTDNNFLTTSRYPKMLSTLRHLRSLRIDRDSSVLLPSADLSNEVKKLASSLEVLELRCEFANTVISNALRSDPSGSEGCAWDMRSHFPHLRVLELEGDEKNAFNEAELTLLPSSLRSLTIYGIDWNFATEEAHWLPGLEELILKRRTRGRNLDKASLVKKLPPTLKKLSGISIMSAWNSDMKLTSLFPRTLEKLDEWDCFPHWSSELTALPPSLTKLDLLRLVDYMGASATDVMATLSATLPNLRFLAFNNGSDGVVWDYDLISLLPRSLTSLKATLKTNRDALPEVPPPSAWPPALCTLMSSGTPMFLALPSSLTRFEGQYSATPNGGTVLSSLPRSLKELAFTSMPVEVPIGPDMPSTLTRLGIGTPLTLNRIDFLPPTLTALIGNLRITSYEDHPSQEWPSSLKEIIVKTMPIDLFKRLPSSLTLLRVARIAAESTDSISFMNLPSGLTKLRVSKPCNAALADCHDAFRNLTALKHLIITDHYTFPGLVLRNLPPTILEISLKVSSVAAADLNALPDNLLDLTLGAALTPSLVDLLPVRITVPDEWDLLVRAAHQRRFKAAVKISDQCPDPRVVARFAHLTD